MDFVNLVTRIPRKKPANAGDRANPNASRFDGQDCPSQEGWCLSASVNLAWTFPAGLLSPQLPFRANGDEGDRHEHL